MKPIALPCKGSNATGIQRAGAAARRCRARAGILGLALLLACIGMGAVAATLQVQISGKVAKPGWQQLADGARLSDALLAAEVLPEAYPLGAAWLRPSLREEQLRWQAGLLYDIGQLEGHARIAGNAAIAEFAATLERRWQAMPVTGRQRMALLDPRPLEISPQNHLLASGDRIIYPARPAQVQIRGAVHKPCTLPFVPMQTAREYLPDCRLAAAADPDWLHIIQPDGHSERRGIALWNRQPGQVLAPGAIVYVPVDPKYLPAAARDTFNHDAVRFLSTQILAVDGSFEAGS
ncbi:MAG TPA: capsule biosynthesis GfcC family protein [Salinisphaeraceae bacterium]|nr:capsule biosynthesis GfcC family protein [Salinisphaeraceae bacterium]